MKHKNSLLTVLLVMLASLFGSGEAIAQKAYTAYDSETNTLTFYYDDERSTRGTTFSIVDGDYVPLWNSAYDGPSESITKVVFDASFADARPTTTYDWFAQMPSLTEIEGIEYLNTSEVKSMDRMFNGCVGLTDIDLSYFNTEKVENMAGMFQGCEGLTVLHLESFDTHNVINTESMFNGCTALTAVFIKTLTWDLSGVTSSTDMFKDCANLKGCRGTEYDENYVDKAYAHLDYGGVDPGYFSIPPEAYAHYDGAGKLTFYYDYDRYSRLGETYDLNKGYNWPDWDTYVSSIYSVEFDASFAEARPTSTNSWFADMGSLNMISGLENLNTSEVTNMYKMFFDCYSLTDLDLSHFDTQNVQDMACMFAYCSMPELDLTSFDTKNVSDMSQMFYYSSLNTITVGKGWTMENVVWDDSMFSDCYSLVGGNGTVYDDNFVNGEYARFDLGEDEPGYLTGAFEAYAVLIGGNTLTFYYDMDRADRKGITFDLNHDSTTPPSWSSFSYEVTKVIFDPSFTYVRPEVTYCWFADMSNLTEIEGIEYLNTSKVTSMISMFYNCSSLTSIDVSHFNTQNVTTMHSMFRGSGVKSLDLSSFDTWNVALMGSMFRDCSALETIYVYYPWTTDNVTDDGAEMFAGCTSLAGGTGTAYDESYTDKTYALIDEGEENPGYLTYMGVYAVLDEAGTLTYYNDGKRNKRAGTVYEVGGSIAPRWDTFSDHGYLSIKAAVVDPSMATARPTSTRCWFASLHVDEIKGLEYINTSEVTDMYYMFKGCSAKSLDLSHFDTRKVTDMSSMFYGCSSLTSLDLSTFNTENVTNMGSMFEFCTKLENIDLSSFDTKNVTDLSGMFRGCEAMEEIDLYNFETANVTRYGFMFRDCTNLTTIFVGDGWEVHTVDFDDFMFSDSPNLVGGAGTVYDENHVEIEYAHADEGDTNPGYLTKKEAYTVFANKALTFYFDGKRLQREGNTYDLYSVDWVFGSDDYKKVTTAVFDPSFAKYRPTSTNSWFYGMTHLTELQGLENLNTSEVYEMSEMFRNCEALTKLDLSSFDTHNVYSFTCMFAFDDYSTLETLDLSSFDTSNATIADAMFYGCTELKTIYVGDGWDMSTPLSYGNTMDMFYNCTNIVGSKGTTFDDSYTDGTYARIDGGEEAPGYLSEVAEGDPADVNGDGSKNTADVVAVYTFIEKGATSGFTREACDVNRDGNVNTADVVAIYTAIVGSGSSSSRGFNKQVFRILAQ